VADFVSAARKAGLGVGLYYSPLDSRFPGFFFPGIFQPSAIDLREQYERQIDELASHYGKLDILWFDGGGNECLGFAGVEFTDSPSSAPGTVEVQYRRGYPAPQRGRKIRHVWVGMWLRPYRGNASLVLMSENTSGD
jgi:hypothetical protein